MATAVDRTRWKHTIAVICAILLGIIFLVSGGWKVLNPFRTGELLEQARVPAGFGVIGAASLGTIELLAAFLLFTPRFRRWGGLLGSALLIFFIAWVGYYYPVLAGQECSCFPLIKRTVGPGFFVGDGIMLLFGLAAYFWSRGSASFKIPALVFGGLIVLAGASYAVDASAHTGIAAPSPIVVDGKQQAISTGNVFLFFYDPECMHCDAAARYMSKLNWGSTKIIAIPTHDPQFAASFLHDTGLKAATSLETDRLRQVFTFGDPPYGVALVDGRQKAAFSSTQFTPPLPAPELKKLGFIQ